MKTEKTQRIPTDVYDSFGEIIGSRLFVAINQTIPDEELYTNIDLKLMKQALIGQEEILMDGAERRRFNLKKDKIRDMGSAFFIHQDLLLVFDNDQHLTEENRGSVQLLKTPGHYSKELEIIRSCIRECVVKDREEDRYIHLVTAQQGEMFTQRFNVKLKPLDLHKYFNDSLGKMDGVIRQGLKQEGGKSLVLLHGDPGTGKTTYIRHLIASIDKPFIYLPPNMTSHLADPSFVSLLSGHEDSVLVVEDADNALVTRNGQNNSAVSNLLNLTDGLLADCFNLKVICTINTSLSRIDPALLRKGRLLAQYEFDLLAADKANQLLLENNDPRQTNEPMTLADIFNAEDHRSTLEKKMVGFKN